MAKAYGKNRWALFLLILAGIVVGSFIGYLVREVNFLTWLNYGMDFAIGDKKHNNVIYVDLGVLVIQFGVSIKITIASVLGAIASVFIYRKL